MLTFSAALSQDDLVFLLVFLAVLLLCLSTLLLLHLCAFADNLNKTAPTLPVHHSDAPVLRLLSETITTEARADVGGSSDDCVVCLSSLEEGGGGAAGTAVLTRCGHEFHAGCIGRWLSSVPACPICRAPAPAERQEVAVPPMEAPRRPSMDAFEGMGYMYVHVPAYGFFM